MTPTWVFRCRYHKITKVTSIILIVRGGVLMQLRDFNTPIFPGHWGFFGGGLFLREKPILGALRELEEELNLLQLTSPSRIF